MKTFFDSSAFAKRYIEEPGSQAVDKLCLETTELAVAVLCVPEIISALNRRVRERLLSRGDYRIAKQRLAEDLRDAVVINVTPSVISASTAILESGPVRAMDALHAACALEWGADIFVSSDHRQITAAKKAGLRTQCV